MSAQKRSQPEDRFIRDAPIHEQLENREGKAHGISLPTHQPGAFGEKNPSHLVEALVSPVQKTM